LTPSDSACLAGTLGLAHETFSGVYGYATKDTCWLATAFYVISSPAAPSARAIWWTAS